MNPSPSPYPAQSSAAHEVGGEPQAEFATAELALTSVHRSPYGSFVLIGRDSGGALLRALVPSQVVPRDPAVGEAWRLTGRRRLHAVYGLQLHAEIALPLIPTGQALVRYLATDRRFPGIGWATAARLWTQFGEAIYDIIRARDYAALAAVVGRDKALAIIDGFGLLADEVAIFKWLDRYGVSPRTAGAAASLWGLAARERIGADPYALALLEPWSDVDARGLRLGVSPADHRRLIAAVEEALSFRFRQGHMASSLPVVRRLVRRLAAPWKDHPDRAVEAAVASGRVVRIAGDLLQSRACRFMDQELGRLLEERLRSGARKVDQAAVAKSIGHIESEAGYRLSQRQREAVFMAASHPVGAITGGAGTGKTTVIKAVLAAVEAQRAILPPDQRKASEVVQVALAGRAAHRMAGATGREALTVARLLHQIEDGGRRLQRGLLIFDESSMLDAPSVYRLLSQLPIDIDLLFVGDSAQLPPIGPGPLFQAILGSRSIPRISLDVIHRQKDHTGIPGAGALIRNGEVPQFGAFNPAASLTPGVFFVPASTDEIASRTLDVFRAMCGPPPMAGQFHRLHSLDVQILTPTRNGPAGSKSLNLAVEAEYMARQERILDWGLSAGSKILWLKNDYKKAPRRNDDGGIQTDPVTGEPIYCGLMNGALGVIQSPHPDGAWAAFDDGVEDAITAADLEKLTYGWAMSVHKAQGSAFRRVIIPVSRSKLLDRAMLYTAITRATETAVLIGDYEAISDAIGRPPKVAGQGTGLTLNGLAGSQQAGDDEADLR